MIRQEIKEILEEALPIVNFESDFLFQELDSLGISLILMCLSDKYHITLGYTDVSPKNFRSLDSLVEMVKGKLSNSKE